MAQLSFEQGLEVLQGRSRAATFIIIAYLALSVVMTFVALGLFGGQINFDSPGNLDGPSTFASITAMVYMAVFFISVILIAMWIYRAHANLHAAGLEQLRFSPGWAVGWFFVPIASLFKPFEAMRELWTESHNAQDSFGQQSPPELVPWWTAYIIGSALKNVSSRLPELGGTGYLLDFAGTLVLIVSAWCLLGIIRKVTAAQASVLTSGHIFA